MNFKNKGKASWGMLPEILSLAWPTMLEQLMQTVVQYVDVAMVGSLGTEATAAVGSTSTVNWLVSSTISALGVGFLAFIAKAYGENDRQKAAKASSQAVLAVLVSGLFFTVLALSLSPVVPLLMRVDPAIRKLSSHYFFILYMPMLFRAASIIFGTALRAAGDTKTPMRMGIVVNIINVILNFFLIFPTRNITIFDATLTIPGADMKVIGAAIASAIAFTVGGICMTGAFYCHPVISPRGQRLVPDREVLKPCLAVAFPNMLQRFGTSLGYVAFASMINSLGDVATAAHTIANTVESAFYIPGYGMQSAAATLAGNAYGAKDAKRINHLASTVIRIEVLLMVLSGGLLFAFAPALMTLFAEDPRVIRLGSTVLRMVAVSEPFYGVSIIMEGMMQGVGKTMTPFLFHIVGMWGIRIVGTFIGTQLLPYGLVMAWSCMIAHNLFLFAAFLYLWRSGRWNPLSAKDTK